MSASPGAPASDPRPLARQLADDIREILDVSAPRFEWTGEQLVKRGWRRGAASAEPVWCLEHRHTIPCPECGPTPAMIAAAARTAYQERYSVSSEAWDRIPEVGDNSRDMWRRIVEPVLRAALTAQEPGRRPE